MAVANEHRIPLILRRAGLVPLQDSHPVADSSGAEIHAG
jgi:hypothetical protein